jgi:hypothetical protein
MNRLALFPIVIARGLRLETESGRSLSVLRGFGQKGSAAGQELACCAISETL